MVFALDFFYMANLCSAVKNSLDNSLDMPNPCMSCICLLVDCSCDGVRLCMMKFETQVFKYSDSAQSLLAK